MRIILNKRLVNSLLAIALELGISIANAQDSKGSVLINGLGQRVCSKMISDINEYPVSTDVYSAYIDGFSSAMNVALQGKANYLEGTDKKSRYLFVFEYCQNNSTETIFQAINQLYIKETGQPINELSAPPNPVPCKPVSNISKQSVKEAKPAGKMKKPAAKAKKPSDKNKKTIVKNKKYVKKKLV
jgi:hypothetical protein